MQPLIPIVKYVELKYECVSLLIKYAVTDISDVCTCMCLVATRHYTSASQFTGSCVTPGPSDAAVLLRYRQERSGTSRDRCLSVLVALDISTNIVLKVTSVSAGWWLMCDNQLSKRCLNNFWRHQSFFSSNLSSSSLTRWSNINMVNGCTVSRLTLDFTTFQ